jgi:outer membrane protein assembly factor BamB
MRTTYPVILAASALFGLFVTAGAQTRATDYTQWRGQNRDGSASGFVEPKAWPEKLTLKWKVEIGEGYATPILVGNRVYEHTRRDGAEVLMALEADTGKTIWETKYAAPYKMNPATARHGQGPKATPLFYENKLFTLGITGIVSAFDAGTGKLLWQKPAPPVDPLYGTAMSPIADHGLIIVHVGGHNQGALTAFEANTGAVKWTWNGDGPSYGSPIVATLGGTRQVITMTQQYIVGVDAETGALLWQRPWGTKVANNDITPIVYRDTVIVSGQDRGVTAFKPAKQGNTWNTDTVWETQEVSMWMSNGVLLGDTLYGLSHRASGQYFALDAKTGKVLWLGQGRQASNSAVVKAGDLLFLLNDDGQLIVARGNPSGLQPVRQYVVAENATWAQPAISGNRLFIKDVSTLALWTIN